VAGAFGLVGHALYTGVIRPSLFAMDPEEAHNFIHRLLPTMSQTGLLGMFGAEPAAGGFLKSELAGVTLASPVGLAAGFDKNGVLIDYLAGLGFGFAEIGSVTGRPSAGNPRPRLFRLPEDEALVNRLGLNGEGAEAVAKRLSRKSYPLPVGLNIAKTNHPEVIGDKAVEDVLFTFNQVKDLPVTYITINASCPNTHDGIIREKQELNDILQEISKANRGGKPIFLKLSPDSTDELVQDIMELADRFAVQGFVLGNTTTSRDGLKTSAGRIKEIGAGGLSGKPLKSKALNLVRRINSVKKRGQHLIACGGISSASDVVEFQEAGASQVQLYTALVYEGPGVVSRINRELERLRR